MIKIFTNIKVQKSSQYIPLLSNRHHGNQFVAQWLRVGTHVRTQYEMNTTTHSVLSYGILRCIRKDTL